jgi:hypothetical protein
VTKKIEFAYEKKKRSARMTQTVVTIAVCLLVAGYLFYSGDLSTAKLLALIGRK